MAVRSLYADRVIETTTTTGTGTLTLAGAISGAQSFTTAFVTGTRVNYVIQGSDGSFEEGTGIFTSSGTTLTREVVFSSSNGGALINLPTGTHTVFCDLPAQAIADIALSLYLVMGIVPQ